MKEPYKLVKTIDESKVTSLGAGVDSLVIGAVVNSPSGRTERVRVNNASEFISEYLVNDSVLASDDTTVQHIAKILDKSPMYIVRVDPTNIRVGTTSYGRKLYFNKNFELISKYKLAELTYNDTGTTDISVTIKSADGTETTYDKNNLDGELTLDNFFIKLKSKFPEVVLGLSGNTAIISGEIKDGYTGFAKIDSINLTGDSSNAKLMKYTLDSSIDNLMGDANYITVGNYNFYSGTNIPDNGLKNYQFYTRAESMSLVPDLDFSLYLVDAIQSVSGIPDPIIISQDSTLTFASGKYNLLGANIDTYLKIGTNFENKPLLSNLSSSQIVTPFAVMSGDISTSESKTLYVPKVSKVKLIDYVTSVFTNTSGFTEVTVNKNSGTLDNYNVSFTFNEHRYTIESLPVVQLDKFNGANSSTPSEYITPQLFMYLMSKHVDIIDATLSVNNNESSISWENDVNPGISDATSSNLIKSYGIVDPATNLITRITHTTSENNSDELEDNYWVKIDSIVFYCGATPSVSVTDTLIKLSSDKLRLKDFLSELYSSFATYFTGAVTVTYDADYNQHTQIIVANISGTITASTNIDAKVSSDIIQSKSLDKFAIVPAFPCTKDIFKFSYEKNTTEFDEDQGVYDIDLYYKDSPTSYQMSFNDTVFDGYGRSLYYNNINEGDNKSPYFKVIKLDGSDEFDSFESKSWGSEIVLVEPKSPNYKEAAAKFLDYEDVYYDIIWDAGYCDASYQKYLTTICGTQSESNLDYLNALAVISVDPACDDVSSINSYIQNVGVDTYRGYTLAPGYVQDVFGGFGSKFTGTTAYIEKLIDNFNSVTSEFDPTYGPTNGLVNSPNLITDLNKLDRESLLDNRVNTIFNGRYGFQINFNKTLQKAKSYLDEEQNVRIANAIAHVADRYAETLIGQYNTAKLRSEVESRLYDLIRSRVVANKNKCIDAIKIICNDENNPQSIIDNQQLVIEVQVAYLRSIAYVIVYNKVKKLGSI